MKKPKESINKSDYTEEEWKKKVDELLETGEPFVGRFNIPDKPSEIISSTYEYIIHLLKDRETIEVDMSKFTDGMGSLHIEVYSGFEESFNEALKLFFYEYIDYDIGVSDIFEVITDGKYKFYIKDGEVNIKTELDLGKDMMEMIEGAGKYISDEIKTDEIIEMINKKYDASYKNDDVRGDIALEFSCFVDFRKDIVEYGKLRIILEDRKIEVEDKELLEKSETILVSSIKDFDTPYPCDTFNFESVADGCMFIAGTRDKQLNSIKIKELLSDNKKYKI